jgi:hypothetical protein
VVTVEQLVVAIALHVVDHQADDARDTGHCADEMQHVGDDRQRAIAFDSRSFDAHGPMTLP